MIKLILDAADFAAALRFVSMAIERRNTIPVLGQFRLLARPQEPVILEATNLDQVLTRKVNVIGADELVTPLALILPPRPVLQFMSGAKGTVTLTYDPKEKTCSLELDGTTMRLRVMVPPEDWPDTAYGQQLAQISAIPADKLMNAVRASRVCVSHEETRYYLNGARFVAFRGELRVVATDGHRLSAYDIHIPWDFPGTTVPSDALGMIEKAIGPKASGKIVTATLFARGTDIADVGRVLIEGPDWTIMTKTIDGTYPDYTRVMPPDCNDLGCVMTRAALSRLHASPNNSNPVKITPSAGTMEVDSMGDGFSITAPCTNTGDMGNTASFGIALRLLRAFCTLSDTIQLQGRGGSDPFRVIFADPDLTCVVMPMRI